MKNTDMLMLNAGHKGNEIAKIDVYNLMDKTAIKAMDLIGDE